MALSPNSSTSRWFQLAAVIALAGVFLFPLWQITLEAAQFPGGLQMHIWINKVSGSDKHIVKNINILNHYIGMQAIHPESIPELKYFPFVAYGMMALGLLGIWINKVWYYGFWFLLLATLGALGIYDFYLWLYDYGHNLDPKAPIKVPGMSYMPPLLGEKDLLNFYVKSYPHFGGGALGLAVVLGFASFWAKWKFNKMQ
ncbi:hypothetical protein [Cyclobacterium jeungdonense]|uniref:Copper chaperone NosL n=1 Tax=Cyclobacterium jeungdonense TaxID=708087 RepID=A0ABT8C7G3_9BACT|nr:hypothetical protein [Cyclobacterium jeungdonense]MDN3688733.1 hypothetical protein [Cyclobacterium jeungdonense]